MKNIIQVSLGKIAFRFEEDAYNELREYLKDLENNLGDVDGKEELISDIEHRMAEILQQRIQDTEQPVNLQDIKFVLKTIGSVEEITEGIGSSYKKGSFKGWFKNRQMKRDTKNGLLGGVCAGLGQYFKIDPVVIRLIAILGIIYGIGTTIVIYIILWIILPDNLIENVKNYRSFYRSKEDGVVAGICSGLAIYTGLDKVLFRVIFLVSIFFFGMGLFIYLITWIITPSKPKEFITKEI